MDVDALILFTGSAIAVCSLIFIGLSVFQSRPEQRRPEDAEWLRQRQQYYLELAAEAGRDAARIEQGLSCQRSGKC